jgi:hypothetical protein
MKTDRDLLEGLITEIVRRMEAVPEDSDEYETLLSRLERLHKLREGNKPKRVSRDTLATIAGNLAGILVIVMYEQKHVMTSKAFTIFRPANNR